MYQTINSTLSSRDNLLTVELGVIETDEICLIKSFAQLGRRNHTQQPTFVLTIIIATLQKMNFYGILLCHLHHTRKLIIGDETIIIAACTYSKRTYGLTKSSKLRPIKHLHRYLCISISNIQAIG